ncbi:unnamed protein product [Macrosiphum euphorbiae]|uniref:TTF-type domain-containing protein n=1 Tax=Macrosiphum euphorbiae TaxID=13131 RepID=A0AAV0XEZ9_9HEMI|nr:unnamed protein product [Macrosiphum euphorbiae]
MFSIFEKYKCNKQKTNCEANTEIFATASTSSIGSITSESEDIGIMADMQEVMNKDDSTFIEPISVDPNVSVTSNLSDLGDMGHARPILQVYPKTKFGIQNRPFSSKLYSNYDWLEYSVRKDLVFCYFCRICGLGNYNEDTDTFTTKGFQNWRKIREKCNSHSSSKQHLINKTNYTAYLSSKSNGSVVSKLSEGHQKEVNENREYLTILIEILLYLSRQGIPLRGHFEDKNSLNQGNFKEACHLLKKI